MRRPQGLAICLLPAARAFSTTANSPAAKVYAAQYGSAASVDQAAFMSDEFWSQVKDAIPGFADAPELERYRGFVHNLRTEEPGETAVLPNGQEVLKQFMFPGLQDDVEPARTPFPELPFTEAKLRDLAPLARAELVDLLLARPLADDHAPVADDGEEGEVWNRAAWPGWQFLSLRDAKQWMPGTVRALSGVATAHRFVGIARQAARCRGTLHSDRRNYLLSTLTGLRVPKGGRCAVVVPREGEEGGGDEGVGVPWAEGGERLLADGEVVCLDNTYKHYVYNDAQMDRFVLMVETWHPGLTPVEQLAMATTFAVKDRFTMLSLKQCPWGFSDEELMRAIVSKDVLELEFWRDLAHGLD